jgi:hypothetical protein
MVGVMAFHRRRSVLPASLIADAWRPPSDRLQVLGRAVHQAPWCVSVRRVFKTYPSDGLVQVHVLERFGLE